MESQKGSRYNDFGNNPTLAMLRYPEKGDTMERVRFWAKVARWAKSDGLRCAALATIERLLERVD